MKYDVIIVGGGAAGLTAAAYASRAGRSAALFEKQKNLGGLVHSINQNGFIFDTGLRAIENSGIILPMAAELGLPLKYVRSPVSLGIKDRIITIDSRESVDEYKKLLESIYPENRADIALILRTIRAIMRDMDVLYGIDNPLFKDLTRDYNFILKVLLPWSLKFVSAIRRINKMNTPVEEFLDTLTANQSLKNMIGQHFFRNTPAFFAMSYFSVYLDYLYPEGGTGKLMELLASHAADHGAVFHTDRTIMNVDPEARTITDSDGTEHSYSSLIWCCDLKTLYRSIDTASIKNPGLMRAVENRRGEVESCRGGDSVFSVFLSLDENPEYFHRISEGHFFYTPSPEGLGEIRSRELSALIAGYDGSANAREGVRKFISRLLELNTFEISIPVLKDPSLAPPGKTGMIVSWLFDFDLLERIRNDGWYDECREFCVREVVRVLSESIYPGLESKIMDHFTVTPVTIADYTGNSEGAITGWAFKKGKMPVVNDIRRVARSVLTPMPGIFQAGQWAYSPSGLPIAILTGKLAAVRAAKSK